MSAIKISDLSIGDWVRYRDADANVRVSDIYSNGYVFIVGEEDSGISESLNAHHYIEPIPLTPEILEKNGFTRWVQGSNKGDYYLDIPRTKRVWLYYDFGTYKMAYIRNTGGCETFFKCRDIASVHQLQHALRLAGVEKEIEV